MTSRFERLTGTQKIMIVGLLAMLPTILFPQSAAANTAQNKMLAFEIKNVPNIPNVETINGNLVNNNQTDVPAVVDPITINAPILQDYLNQKGSPLAPYAADILKNDNWKLVLAISNGESTMCKRQMYNNCWGVGGAWNLKRYKSFSEGFADVDRLLTEKYIVDGLDTPKEIARRYVGSYSPTWVAAVSKTLNELNQLPIQEN